MTKELVQAHLYAYDQWLLKSDINYVHRRGINQMMYKWGIDIKCACTSQKLEYIDHTITLSWQRARDLVDC